MDEVIDQPTNEIVDEQAVDQQQEITQDIDQQAQQADADKIDGRKFNPEWSKALKELRELYPDRADMLTKLRDTYGRYGAVMEMAPKGVEDVRGWKTTLDALGGSEAAADMMQRVATMDQVDAKIEAGDFSVVGELPDTLQKGFYQMIPDALNHLAQNDEKAFAAAVMPHFAAALEGTGMGEHLKAMYAKADGNPELQGLIKQQYDWFQQQVAGKGNIGGSKSVDPQVARLQSELDSRRKSDDTAFIQGVTDSTNGYVKDSFGKLAEVYAKQFNLTDPQKADLMDSFNVKLVEKLAGDAGFQKQLAAFKSLKNRSPDQVNTYIQSKVDENAKSIIDGLVTARYGGQKRRTPATEATTTTSGGAVRVAQPPPRDQWDMDKMDALGYEATAKKGIYHLQGGRVVQLARPN